MSASKDQNKTEKPITPVERDVLGLEKPTGNSVGSNANPKLIFIGLAVIIVGIVIFWLVINH